MRDPRAAGPSCAHLGVLALEAYGAADGQQHEAERVDEQAGVDAWLGLGVGLGLGLGLGEGLGLGLG